MIFTTKIYCTTIFTIEMHDFYNKNALEMILNILQMIFIIKMHLKWFLL